MPVVGLSRTHSSNQVVTDSAAGAPARFGLSGLTGNVTYYAAVFLGDEVTMYSGLGNIAQLLTRAYPPTVTGFSDMTVNGFTVGYVADNSTGTQYYVEASTSVNFSSVTASGWISASSAAFSGLELNMTYYVRGKARNGSSVETLYSDLGNVMLVSDMPNPLPHAVRGSVSGVNFTMSWDQVVSTIYGGSATIFVLLMAANLFGMSQYVTNAVLTGLRHTRPLMVSEVIGALASLGAMSAWMRIMLTPRAARNFACCSISAGVFL